MFDQLWEWNKETFPWLEPSVGLPPTEQTIGRWTPDQLKVGLIFREQTFAEGSTKQELFDQLMAWNTATFPTTTRPTGRKRAAAMVQTQNASNTKRGKKGEIQRASKRSARAPLADEDDSDEESDTDTGGTNRGKTKARQATAQQLPPSESGESENDSESETDDLFKGQYKSPIQAQAADVRVSVNAELWGKSFAIIKKKASESQNFKDLIPTTAESCNPNTVIFLYHDQGFYLYNVIEKQSSYARVTLITSNGDTAPFKKDKVDFDQKVMALSKKSIKYFRRQLSAGGPLTVKWPEQVCAMSKDIEDDNPTRGPSNMASSSFEDVLRSAISRSEEETSGAPKKSTPRGQGLTEQAAKVLSMEPERMRKTGNVVAYNHLLYLPALDPMVKFRRIDVWRCQVQPAHLLQLIRNVASVDIRLFGHMCDVMSDVEALQISNQLMAHDTEVGAVPQRLDILNGDVNRLDKCLCMFALTLDVWFKWRPAIRTAVQTAIIRVVQFARHLNAGPGHPQAPHLHLFLARDFQLMLARGFGPIVGEAVDSMNSLVKTIEDYPDMTQFSQFTADISFIRVHSALPASMMMSTVTPTKKAIHPTGKGKDKKGKAQPATITPTASATAQKTKPSPAVTPVSKAKLICGFFNSKAGCKQDATTCRGDHRKPSSPADEDALTAFFVRFKNSERKQ